MPILYTSRKMKTIVYEPPVDAPHLYPPAILGDEPDDNDTYFRFTPGLFAFLWKFWNNVDIDYAKKLNRVLDGEASFASNKAKFDKASPEKQTEFRERMEKDRAAIAKERAEVDALAEKLGRAVPRLQVLREWAYAHFVPEEIAQALAKPDDKQAFAALLYQPYPMSRCGRMSAKESCRDSKICWTHGEIPGLRRRLEMMPLSRIAGAGGVWKSWALDQFAKQGDCMAIFMAKYFLD